MEVPVLKGANAFLISSCRRDHKQSGEDLLAGGPSEPSPAATAHSNCNSSGGEETSPFRFLMHVKPDVMPSWWKLSCRAAVVSHFHVALFYAHHDQRVIDQPAWSIFKTTDSILWS